LFLFCFYTYNDIRIMHAACICSTVEFSTVNSVFLNLLTFLVDFSLCAWNSILSLHVLNELNTFIRHVTVSDATLYSPNSSSIRSCDTLNLITCNEFRFYFISNWNLSDSCNWKNELIFTLKTFCHLILDTDLT